MNYKLSASEIRELIVAKLSHNFGVTPAEATDEHYYKAVVLILRDLMTEGRKEFIDQAEKENRKQVYYLCMEFLMGRSFLAEQPLQSGPGGRGFLGFEQHGPEAGEYL